MPSGRVSTALPQLGQRRACILSGPGEWALAARWKTQRSRVKMREDLSPTVSVQLAS